MGAGSHKRRNEARKAKSFSSDAMKKTTEITHVLFPLLKQESQGRSNKMSLMMPKKEKTFSISMTTPVSHTQRHTHTHTHTQRSPLLGCDALPLSMPTHHTCKPPHTHTHIPSRPAPPPPAPPPPPQHTHSVVLCLAVTCDALPLSLPTHTPKWEKKLKKRRYKCCCFC